MKENQFEQPKPQEKLESILEISLDDEKKNQDFIWRGPTDQEVDVLSSKVKTWVEKVKAPTKYKPATHAIGYTDEVDFIKLSNTKRLIDLGSADDLTYDIGSLLLLESADIKEYVSVDAAFGENRDLKVRESATEYIEYIKKIHPDYTYTEPEPENRIKIKTLKQEILSALHSMPNDYGNVVSMGLDSIVFKLDKKWILAVLAEIKRVVPEGGIVFTDGMYLDEALEMCCPEFKKVKKMINLGLYSEITKEQKKEKEEFLLKYRCNENDPYSKLTKITYEIERLSKPGVKYCVDLPQIGFRVYFDEIDMSQPMFLVNIKKTREQE